MSGSAGALRRTCRRAGWDRNPMRRREDRLQSAAVLVLTLLFLILAPVLALTVGTSIYRAEHLAVQADLARLHRVQATVVETGKAPLYSPITPATVSWREPDGSERRADYPSTKFIEPGATLTIWLDGAGEIVQPPSESRAASKAILLLSGVLSGLAAGMVIGYLLLRFGLDRRRMRRWDSEWVTADLLWGNRG